MKSELNIHATGLFFEGCGVLIRAESGAGKSILALELLEFAKTSSLEGRLVGDDRLNLFCRANRLYMAGPKNLQGKIELCGYGIVERPFVQDAAVNLVVDIVSDFLRMPEEKETTTSLMGVQLPRCPVAKSHIIGLTHQRMIVVETIKNLQASSMEKDK